MALPRRTPPVNAELTKVSTITSVPDGGGGVTDTEVTVWSGTAPCYVTQKVEFVEAGGGILEDFRTQVSIPSTVPGTATVSIGDILTYNRNGTTFKRSITSLEDRVDFGFFRINTREFTE